MNKILTVDHKRKMKINDFESKLCNYIGSLKKSNINLFDKLLSESDVFIDPVELLQLKSTFSKYLKKWISENYNFSDYNLKIDTIDSIKDILDKYPRTGSKFDELFLYYNVYNYIVMAEIEGLFLITEGQ